MTTRTLGNRALNRAVLERQLLLARAADLSVVDAVERMLGLNAQSPNPPYLALWSRLASFAGKDLTAAIENRELVRLVLMRATQHLVTGGDFALIRPAVDPLLRRVHRNTFGRRIHGIDLDALVAEARELLADGTVLTRPEIGRRLAASRPGADASALGWTVGYLLPVVHPAPSGTWNTYGATPFELTHIPEAIPNTLPELVRRYLAAFGPATVSDARAWCGISGLKEVFEGLRPSLRTYRDESGRELFDLPDAPLPAEDMPAPVRLLPEFDQPLLAYADRTRLMTDEVRRQVCVGDAVAPTVLVDGTVAASWSTAASNGTTTLTVHPFRRLAAKDRRAIEAEAAALLAFAWPDSAHEVIVER
jgi:hypothetical protein